MSMTNICDLSLKSYVSATKYRISHFTMLTDPLEKGLIKEMICLNQCLYFSILSLTLQSTQGNK